MPHILKRSDDSISVLFSTDGANGVEEASKVALANAWEYVGEHVVPGNRYFRECWKWDSVNSVIVVDLPMAVSQKMSEIRAERNKRLIASDGEMARASETGTEGEVASLKAYRQALRVIPENVESLLLAMTEADSIETFEVSWPTL